MEILVFKTNISIIDLSIVQKYFDNMPNIQKWTIDFDDCDNVLRIETTSKDLISIIIENLKNLGLMCEEL